MPNQTGDYTIVAADDDKTFTALGAHFPPAFTLDDGLPVDFGIRLAGGLIVKPPVGERIRTGAQVHAAGAAVRVTEIRDNHLIAKISGEPIDADRHEFYTEVKAVTYHRISIARGDERWRGQVILDI